MPASDHKSGIAALLHWLVQGWRQATFSVLAVYAVAAVVFLVLGGGSPESSMADMEQEIVAAANDAQAANDGQADNDAQAGNNGQAGNDGQTTSAAVEDCDQIDPLVLDGNIIESTGQQNENVHQITFNTLADNPAALSAYAGCPLVINFFASWCVPCVTEMPEFEQFWNQYGEQVAVIGLAVEQAEPAREIVAETGVTYLVGLDENDLFIELGGLGMPTTVFVSAEGVRLNSHSGILTFDDLVERANEHFDLNLQ